MYRLGLDCKINKYVPCDKNSLNQILGLADVSISHCNVLKYLSFETSDYFNFISITHVVTQIYTVVIRVFAGIT